MPNRILREGILTSVAVNSLSPQAEVFYRRLMSVVDDFGRFDGMTQVIFGRLYALQSDRIQVRDLDRWIAECEKVNLIRTYSVNGKKYLTLKNLGEPRAKKSKYPPPPDEAIDETVRANVDTCAQMRARANICTGPPNTKGADGSDFSFQGEGSGERVAPKPPPGSWLAQQWLIQHKGPKSRVTELNAVMEVMDELLRRGVSQAEIERRIADTDRDRSEPIWEFSSHWKPKPGRKLRPTDNSFYDGAKAFANAGKDGDER